MKKNKLVATGLVTLAALTLVSTSALAAEAGSKGKVKFTEPSVLPPSPFDPTDPNFPPAEIEEEEEGHGKGTSGVLRFERVPNFDFGEVAISPGKKTLSVKDESYKLKGQTAVFYAAPTVEITDGRGNAPGWTASVKSDGVFAVEGDTSIAPFSGVIKLNEAKAASYTEGVAAGEAPGVTQNLTLTNDFKPFATAANGEGNASWGISYYTGTAANRPSNKGTTQGSSAAVTLEIASGTKVTQDVNYTTSIVWQLEATP